MLDFRDELLRRPSFLCETLTPTGFARRVDVSLTTIHKGVSDEEDPLPAGYIGNKRLIHVPTGDAWLKRRLGITETPSHNEVALGDITPESKDASCWRSALGA